MAARAIEQRAALKRFHRILQERCEDEGIARPTIMEEQLSQAEWLVVIALQKVLQPFSLATQQLQGDGITRGRATSGGFWEVFPLYEHLLDHLEHAAEGTVVLEAIKENGEIEMEEVDLFEGMDTKTRRILKVYLRLGYIHLRTYYEKMTPVAYAAAVIFHPCKKWRALERAWESLPRGQREWKTYYNKKLRALWEDEYQQREIEDKSQEYRGTPEPMDFLERRAQYLRVKHHASQGSQSRRRRGSFTRLMVVDELAQYLEEPPLESLAYNREPLAWWRDVGASRFPRLSVMAVDILTIASSTAETERGFSSCGEMDSARRGRMRREIMAKAQCLRSWAKAGVYEPKIPLHLLERSDWQQALESITIEEE